MGLRGLCLGGRSNIGILPAESLSSSGEVKIDKLERFRFHSGLRIGACIASKLHPSRLEFLLCCTRTSIGGRVNFILCAFYVLSLSKDIICLVGHPLPSFAS